jgi:hypothetical protein
MAGASERRPLLVLTAANALFHFAQCTHAALLGRKRRLLIQAETPFISACIIIAQLVTIPRPCWLMEGE